MRKIWLVALFGFFLSASTQMLYSHLALFLKFNLNLSSAKIANIDGLVEFLSYFVRIFSGAISDYIHNRKLLLLLGCSIACLVKPIFAFANSTILVVSAEILERFGSGIQASPRDALIADISSREKLGSSFGFCKAMKTFGGILGASIAVAIMYISNGNYQMLFTLSSIPVLAAIFCIIKIPSSQQDVNRKFDNPFKRRYLKSLDKNFWLLIFLAFVCELGHFTEALLTIRTSQLLSSTISGITSIFSALGQIVFAYFMGKASDKIQKTKLLNVSLLLILMAYGILSTTSSIPIFLLGVSIVSGQYVVLQLLFLAMINERISPKLRGTAIGVFYFAIGIAYMLASKMCGWLFETQGYEYAFGYSFIVTIIAMFFFVKYSL